MIKLAIISALHGDERIGEEIYNALINTYPKLGSQVVLLVGNKAAHKLGKRFVDIDMNRIFADDEQNPNQVEYQEVKRLKSEIQKYKPDFILDLHSTKRNSGVFIITDEIASKKKILREAFYSLPACVVENKIVDHSFVKYYENCISIEVSIKEINQQLINRLSSLCAKLVDDSRAKKTNNDIAPNYRVKDLITEEDYLLHKPLTNWKQYGNRTAIMAPEKPSDMSSNYYGFWGEIV